MTADLRKALELARKRIEYLSSFLLDRHAKANETEFFPIIDAALAQSRPVTAGRDEIARIIDPLIFELWSGSGGHHYQRDWDKALAKADAILALGPAVSPQEPAPAPAFFDPSNHHNALLCPYCNPNDAVRAAVIEECARKIEEMAGHAGGFIATAIRALALPRADRSPEK